jgi:hypothetical protein
MATNYGDTIFEGELSPSVTQVNPVVDKSGEYLASGLKSTVDNVNSILFSNDKKAARADAAKNTLFGEIAERVSYYADAREQGVSQDEILRKLRVDSLAWVANNPGLTEDIYTFQNKLLQENGLAGSITRETPIEAGNRKKIEQATADGWDVSTPQGMQTYDRFLLQTNQLKQLEQEISAATAEGRLVSAKMQNEATLTLHGIVQTGTSWVNNQISKANKLLAEAQDPKSRTAIIQQTKQAVAQQLAFIGAQKSAGGTIDTSYLTAGIDNIMKTWEETANGTADLAALETAQKTAETQAYMMALQADPKLATLIALDKASKFQDPSMIMQLDAAKMAVYNKLFESGTTSDTGVVTPAGKPGDMIENIENVGQIASMLKDSTKTALNTPDASPEETAAQANKLFNTMRSINVYGPTDTDAKNFMAVVDLFSDVSVGKFLEKNAQYIDPSIGDQAKKIIQQQYDAVVMPLINDEWQTTTEMVVTSPTSTDEWNRKIGLGPQRSGSAEDVDISKMVEPVWNGTGLEFQVSDQFATDPNIRGIAKKLNTDVAPAVNKLVRTFAHLSGTTDYEKIYNEQYASRLFVTDDETDSEAGAKLDELTNIPEGYSGPAPTRPSDWTGTPTSSVKGRAGQLLDSIGEAEGASYNTLYGYAERPGGAFDGTDVTKMSIQEVQDLQKKMVKNNGISSAVGKYQFLQTTLREAVKALGISPDEKFTPEIQDRLALWLLQTRTDYQSWLSGVGDDKKFQDQLAKIWASVPDTTGKSAYAGDGVNNATSGGRSLIGML